MSDKTASSPPTSLNVRLKPELAQQLHEFTQAHGITATEAVRVLLTRAFSMNQKFPEDAIQVDIQLPDTCQADDTCFVGTLSLKVTVPEELQSELGRIVFVLPEFTTKGPDRATEPYRIDNAYYLRVSNPRVVVDRKADPRAVITFRLVDGSWTGSLFRYSHNVTDQEMIEDVRQALVQAIKQPLRLKLAGMLPDDRELTAEEYSEYIIFDDDIRRPIFKG